MNEYKESRRQSSLKSQRIIKNHGSRKLRIKDASYLMLPRSCASKRSTWLWSKNPIYSVISHLLLAPEGDPKISNRNIIIDELS